MLQTTLLGLFGVLLATSLLGLLWGGDRTRGPRGAVTLVTALVVLTLLIRPLAALLQGDYDLRSEGIQNGTELEEQYWEVFEETVTLRGEQDLTKGIYQLLESRYRIAENDADIRILYGEDGILDSIRITLRGKALLQDPRAIQSDFENILKCNVEVR